MLAFTMRNERITFPCFVQPKLNGLRGIYDPRVPSFQSRNGETWKPEIVEHVVSSLTPLGQIVLDGEFYKHGLSLQEINSRLAVTRCSPHKEGKEIEFHIFDVMCNLPFHRRAELLTQFAFCLTDRPTVKFVPTQFVETQAEWDYYHNLWLSQGYEGSMWRDPKALYGFPRNCGNQENRWWCIQKRKAWQDMLAEITGLEEMVDGAGKPKDTLGAFHLVGDNGAHFSAGSGLTVEQRDRYWLQGYEMYGKKVHIRFLMLSDSQVPLNPIIECVYE